MNETLTAEQARDIRDLEQTLQWCDREQDAIDNRQEWLNQKRHETELELQKLTALTTPTHADK